MPTPAKITVDFSKVEDRKSRPADHVPEGDYLLQVEGVEIKSKQGEESSKYLNWYFGIAKPTKFSGKHIYHVTTLRPEGLWSLRNLLVDMLGETRVPKKSLDIPLATLVQKKIKVGATLVDDAYTKTDDKGNDKTTIKSKIAATFPVGDFSEEAATEEAGEASDQTETTDEEVDELDVDDL